LLTSFSTSFPVTVIELKNTFISLNNNNLSAYEISNKIVKVNGNCISKPSAYIFNRSLSQGKFLDCLQFCTVIPVFRNNGSSQINNYRPISLLTGFSKTFEILIHQRLVQHISTHNIIFPEQYGFIKGFLTDHATYSLWN
jgi:hypothetical protein